MDQVIRQLRFVRSASRAMLLAQRLMEWTAGVLLALLVLGLLDFWLRFPSGLRLGIALLAGAWAILWLITRLARGLRFQPTLTVLALRAERLYPHLAGLLASGVEFSSHPEQYADPTTTAAMSRSAVDQARVSSEKINLTRLLDPARTLRRAAVFFVVLLISASTALAAPESALLALQRWVLPLSDAQWPKRTNVESLVSQDVWPIDSPLTVAAAVRKGHYANMPVEASYQIVDPRGATLPARSDLLMRPRTTGGAQYERLIDLAADLARLPRQQRATGADYPRVRLWFEAGDDATAMQVVQLVPRPQLAGATVQIDPPTYAAGLVDSMPVDLLQQPSQVIATPALVGSTVRMELTFNKPLPRDRLSASQLVPGLKGETSLQVELTGPSDELASAATVSFRLDDTVESQIQLVDAHGLANLTDRIYRFEAIVDRLPNSAILMPDRDESVLPTAVLELEAAGQDDVGVESVVIEGRISERDHPVELAQQTGRVARLTAATTLALEALDVEPGDELTLTSVVRDVFELDGQRHDPVRSSSRRIRIIDQAELINQVREALEDVRQSARRADRQQGQVQQLSPDRAEQPQQRITRQLDSQASLVDRLKQRLQRNRAEAADIERMLDRADELLEEAGEASEAARQQLQQSQSSREQAERVKAAAEGNPQKLDEAFKQAEQLENQAEAQQQQAGAQQEQVRKMLRDLVQMLDQGRDALAVKMALQQLRQQQQAVAEQTRKALPETLGLTRDQLTGEQRQRLDDLSREQENLAESARGLIDQMRSTAESIEQQKQDAASKATAQALSEAARMAQRQGLSQTMQQAGQSAQQNQLSQAGEQQNEAIETLENMLEEMGDLEQLREEVLRRQLDELDKALRRLIEQQKAHLARVGKVDDLDGLDASQMTIRRNTLAAMDMALGAPETAEAANLIGRAVDDQAAAVVALRAAEREQAMVAEMSAVDLLEQALEEVQKQKEKQEQDEQQEQRDELRQKYLRLIDQQKTIRDQTAPFVEKADLNRRDRIQLMQLGHREADLHVAIQEIADEVADTLAFKYIHERIDRKAARVTETLRGQRVDAGVVLDQNGIIQMLEMLAEALKQDPQPDEFRGNDGGGGGGGGGGAAALVPPLAELKALRAVQQEVYDETRAVNEAVLEQSQRTQRLLELGSQQRTLAALAREMIQKMQQEQQQQQPRVIEPPEPPDDEGADE